MKVVFVGGGSFRTLSVVRSALAQEVFSRSGEICLYDLNALRAEAMGRMIMKTPEYANAACRVTWNKRLEAALEGADAVSIILGRMTFSHEWGINVSRKFGYIGTDNVTPNGAFLGLKAGPVILRYARAMERRCPDAWLLIFANPVAVLSGAVNNHTSIRAMGICEGYVNHRWDLSRLMGREEEGTGFDVDVAGVNHCSFILRGTYRGRDLFKVLKPHMDRGLAARPEWSPAGTYVLEKMIEMYRGFGTMIFSNELDGLCHLFYEDVYRLFCEPRPPLTKAQIMLKLKQTIRDRDEMDMRFRDCLAKELDASFWNEETRKHSHFGRSDGSITTRVLVALNGKEKVKVVVSRPNQDAIPGFKSTAVLEYSQWLNRRGIEPVSGLAIPDAFHGVISALSTFQTLLGDAIATEDPKILYHALYAYPIGQGSKAYRSLCKELLRINRDELSPCFRKTEDYL